MRRVFRLARLAYPLVGIARRKAVRDGLLGGSRVWQVVGVGFLAQKFLRKYGGKPVETVAIEHLKRGETIQIRALDPRSLGRR